MTDKPDSKPAVKPVAAKPVAKPPTPATKAAAAAAKPATAKPAAVAKPAAAKPAAKPLAAAKASAAKKPVANPQKDALIAAVKKTEAVKPATKAAAKPVAKPVKVEKPKKPKLVRDSFTIPEDEYAQLATLKKRLLVLGVAAKKGEIMRAGLALLAAQKDADLSVALKKVTPLKTGRPAK